MRFFGDIKFDGNEVSLGQLVQPSIKSETSFPESAQIGRIVFVNQRVWMMVNMNGIDPVWVPLTNTIDTYVFTQPSPATTWTITHGLNTTTPLVQLYDDATQKMTIPQDVEVTSNNQVIVTFAIPISGRCIVMYGDPTIGVVNGAQVLQPNQVTYTWTQYSPLLQWVIKHNLGYYPIVRVFDFSGEEILPLSVVDNSITQTTITFSAATNGTARFV